MRIELTSKHSIGDRVPWNAPYGMETVIISNVGFNEYTRKFYYEVKEYSFTLNEEELR